MDTHTAMQIFHPIFLVNDAGEHPQPLTPISLEEVEKGVWKVNPAVANSLANGNYMALQITSCTTAASSARKANIC